MVSCAAFAGLLTTVLIPLFFPKYFNESKWTLKKNLLWVLGINAIFALTMFSALNSYLIFGYNSYQELSFGNFLWWFYLQLIFGVPLGIIINLVNQYYLLKKHSKIAVAINNATEKEKLEQVQINLEQEAQKASANNTLDLLEFKIDKYNQVAFSIDDLIYVEALGNYMRIAYRDKENKEITVRETMRNLEQRIGISKTIYKPHRSYFVNLHHIQNITGDSQGLKIHLIGSEKLIPVSRNKIKEFRVLAADIM